MEWINIYAPTLRAPEYIGSDPVARATWFNVLVYCCEQENGGRIVGGASWKDRQWQQTCGVTLTEVNNSDPLLIVDGADVVVWRYPNEKEEEVQRLRAIGQSKSEKKTAAARMNGQKGGRPKENPTETQHKTEQKTQQKKTQKTQQEPIEGNGMEGKEKGREGEGHVTPSRFEGKPSREEWIARIPDCEWPEWWARKWDNLEKVGWLDRRGREIIRWDIEQDGLIGYYRSDLIEHKAKQPRPPVPPMSDERAAEIQAEHDAELAEIRAQILA